VDGQPPREAAGLKPVGNDSPPRTYSPPLFITDSNGDELIPLTTAEIGRLFSRHLSLTRPYAYHERWSRWRRRHQAIAQRCHYQRRNQLHLTLLL